MRLTPPTPQKHQTPDSSAFRCWWCWWCFDGFCLFCHFLFRSLNHALHWFLIKQDAWSSIFFALLLCVLQSDGSHGPISKCGRFRKRLECLESGRKMSWFMSSFFRWHHTTPLSSVVCFSFLFQPLCPRFVASPMTVPCSEK